MARRIDFPRVRSYGDGGAPGERIEITKDVEIDLTGSDILVPLPDCRKHSDGGRR
ncbi:MAG: hypothetical protein ACM319_09560 [Deltaproteobacteria bacterium]|nr:hypothetical protein [Candidatus Deferrimicrobiaceae bacterium]